MADENNFSIDSLNIEIEARATQASSVLSALEAKMKTLSRTLDSLSASAKGIKEAKDNLTALNGAARAAESIEYVTKTYNNLSNSLYRLSKTDLSSLSSQLIKVTPVLADVNKLMSEFSAVGDGKNIQDMAQYYNGLGKTLSSIASIPKTLEKTDTDSLAKNLDSMATSLDRFFGSIQKHEPTMQSFSSFADSVSKVSRETRKATVEQGKLGNSINRSSEKAKGFGQNLSSITKRLLVFKPLYAIFTAVTKDVTDAFKGAAVVDTGFDKTMGDLTGTIKTLNSVLASVAIPLIKGFAPILTQTLSTLYPVLDGLAALLAAINGETKYWKADRIEIDSWTESVEGADKATRQLIGGFDELNIWSGGNSVSSMFSGEMADVPEWMQAIGKVFNKDVILAGALGLGLGKLADKIMGSLVPSLGKKNEALKDEVKNLQDDATNTGLFSNALSSLVGNVNLAGSAVGGSVGAMSLFAYAVANARSETEKFNNTPLEIHAPDTTNFNNTIYGSLNAVNGLLDAINALNGISAGESVGQIQTSVRPNVSTGKASMKAFGSEYGGLSGSSAVSGGLTPGIPVSPGISASDFGYRGNIISIPSTTPTGKVIGVSYDPDAVLAEVGKQIWRAEREKQRYFDGGSSSTTPLFDIKASGVGGGIGITENNLDAFVRKKKLAAATGDVATSPTFRLIGEYAGAMQNPEIVAPQNIMYDTVIEANRELVSVLVQVGQAIVEAIENKDVSSSEDYRSIGRKAVTYINDEIRKGKKPIAAR